MSDEYAVDRQWDALRTVYDDLEAMVDRGLEPGYKPAWNGVGEFDSFLIAEEYPELHGRLDDFSDTVTKFADDVRSTTVDDATVKAFGDVIDHRQLKQSGDEFYIKRSRGRNNDLDDYIDRYKVEIATADSRDEFEERMRYRESSLRRVRGWQEAFWNGVDEAEDDPREQLGSDASWPMYYVEILDDADAIMGMIEERARDDLLDE